MGLIKGTMKTGLLLGGAVAAWLYFGRKRTAKAIINGQPAEIELSAKLKPAPVSKEAVTISSYRLIESRRQGMDYVPIHEGTLSQTLTVVLPRGGTVTRNVVQEGGAILVELK